MTRRMFGIVSWWFGAVAGALFMSGHWILGLIATSLYGIFVGIDGIQE